MKETEWTYNTMSKTQQSNSVASAPKQKYLPSVGTVSLSQMLDVFEAVKGEGCLPGGYSYLIENITASASDGYKDNPDLTNTDLGLETCTSQSRSKSVIDYEIEWNSNGKPVNPLDRSSINTIQKHLNAANLKDAPVSHMTVLFCDKELGKLVGNGEEQWSLTFRSDAVDGEQERQEINKHPENRPLIKNEGFNYRVLNCTRLIDRRQVFMKARANQKPQLMWRDHTFSGLENNAGIKPMRRLHTAHMGKFGFGKTYQNGQEDSIVLVGTNNSGNSPQTNNSN